MPLKGEARFSPLPNTTANFPLPYVPQAVAFLIGRVGHLSAHHAYNLARLCSLAAPLGLLWYAFMLYPTPPIVMALFVLPMSLLQLGSASLDAVTFSTAALLAALFRSGCDETLSCSLSMHAVLNVCLFHWRRRASLTFL